MACKEEKKQEAPRRARGGGPVQAEGFIVRTTSLSENIEVPGTLLPFEVTEIRSEISGRVVNLNIPDVEPNPESVYWVDPIHKHPHG